MPPEPTAADQGTVTTNTPSGSAGAVTSTPGGASTPTAGSAAASTVAGGPGAAAGAGATLPGGAGPDATPAGGHQQTAHAAASARDILAGLGPQYRELAGQYPDDRALVQHLAAERDRAQQLAPYAPYAQQYAQHAGQFQQWLAQQQQAAQQARAQEQQKPWWAPHWNPPEYDQAWEKLVRTDAQGNVVAAPVAPPDVVPKYLNYVQFRDQQARKFLDNPFQYMEPAVRTLAQQIADQAVQKHLGGYRDQQFAQQFVQQHAGWLYQQQNGQPSFDAFGQPLLSPQGQLFAGYVKYAGDRLGIGDVRAQQEYALAMVQRDAYQGQLQQAQGGQSRQQANQQFLQLAAGANHQPAAGGSVPPAVPPGAAPPPSQNRSRSLGERLREEFARDGLTDSALQQQLTSPNGR